MPPNTLWRNTLGNIISRWESAGGTVDVSTVGRTSYTKFVNLQGEQVAFVVVVGDLHMGFHLTGRGSVRDADTFARRLSEQQP